MSDKLTLSKKTGKTLDMGRPKLKPSGIFTRDDYSERSEGNLDAFAVKHDLQLSIIKPTAVKNTWSRSPSKILKKHLMDVSVLRKRRTMP